jgi:hypothetical protein
MIRLTKANGAPAHVRKNSEANRLSDGDRAVHDWYRFVLSFPPHLVRQYVERFQLNENHLVLDPFCGTGTTVVECKKRGIPSVGIEANPIACFASQVKVDWTPDPEGLASHAAAIAERARAALARQGIEDDTSLPLMTPQRKLRTSLRTLPEEVIRLLLTNSISPLPLHKTLVLLDYIKKAHNDLYFRHETLALAKALVRSISNLNFGPEVGVGPIKDDAAVVGPWLNEVSAMADDLSALRGCDRASAAVHQADSRQIPRVLLGANTVDAVITSPPYPNEKDYTRTTRLESVLLGFIHTKSDLRALKGGLIRSNTRNVYKDDDDDRLVASNPEIQRIASEIESRRVELGKTSGFERLYARVTRLYFGGMTRHLAELRPALRRGARLAYVVGDQASYLRVMIRTGQLLADIAQSLGYKVDGIDLFRTRLATATKEQLREEVVLLRWPG